MAGVNYPTMLVSDAEAKADKKKYIYNCVQRAHGNTLEMMPFVLSLSAFLGE
jgi:glutathione S-transferase